MAVGVHAELTSFQLFQDSKARRSYAISLRLVELLSKETPERVKGSRQIYDATTELH